MSDPQTRKGELRGGARIEDGEVYPKRVTGPSSRLFDLLSRLRDEWRRRWHVRVRFYLGKRRHQRFRRPFVGLNIWRNDRNGIGVQRSMGHWRGVLRRARGWDKRQILDWEKSRSEADEQRELIRRWAA